MVIHKREGYKVVILEPAYSRMEKDECPSCGKHKREWTRRKDWRCCSQECTEKFNKMYIYYGWPDIRIKAFKRDGFACVKCGYKPALIKEYLRNLGGGKCIFEPMYAGEGDDSKLDGDHIVPVSLGGEEFDIGNVQTLCHKCHKLKTKEDMVKIAAERRLSSDQSRLIN